MNKIVILSLICIFIPMSMYSKQKITEQEVDDYLTEIKINGTFHDNLEFKGINEKYVYLPISNDNYGYIYIHSNGCIIEKNYRLKNDNYLFNNYVEFRMYYLSLNQRVILPHKIEGLFSETKFMLANNYIKEEKRILNIDKNINYYLNQLEITLFDGIDDRYKNDFYYIESLLTSTIPYNGSEVYELPLLIYFGEKIRQEYSGKWIVYTTQNCLGQKYCYPDILVNGKCLEYFSTFRTVFYGYGEDRIINFEFLFNDIKAKI